MTPIPVSKLKLLRTGLKHQSNDPIMTEITKYIKTRNTNLDSSRNPVEKQIFGTLKDIVRPFLSEQKFHQIISSPENDIFASKSKMNEKVPISTSKLARRVAVSQPKISDIVSFSVPKPSDGVSASKPNFSEISEWVSFNNKNELADTKVRTQKEKISDQVSSALQLVFGKVNRNKLNATDMFKENTATEKDMSEQDEVSSLFNVQYAKLKPQFSQAEEKDNCCCHRSTNYIKLSARLKKSSDFPTEQEYQEISPETPPCNCECPYGNNGGVKIRKTIGGLGSKKLKISVRL